MARIESLTPEQQEELPRFRSEWFGWGTSTARANREKAESAIVAMRAEIDVTNRPVFLWFSSPATSLMAVEILKSQGWCKLVTEINEATKGDNLMANLGDNLMANLGDNLGANLWANLRANLWANLRASLVNNLGDNLWANLRASLVNNLGDNLWDNLRANLMANLGDNLMANLGDNLGANLMANLEDNLRANLGDNLRASLVNNLWANLRDNLRANLGDNLRANLGDNLRANLGDNLRASLVNNLWVNLKDNLRANLGDNLRANFRSNLRDAWWGQHEAYWIAFYLFCRDVVGVEYDVRRSRQLDMWRDVAQSCCWWWCYENYVVISERPIVCRMTEAEGRLHCEDGPALAFADGYSLYRWHGVTVPDDVIAHPEAITVARIDVETNVEVRRVMLERYGEARYLEDGGIKPIQADEWGTLYRKEVPDDEALVMVRVLNSTPSPNGSRKPYFLRVPPTIETAHEAVAWTFGVKAKDYRPTVES